MSVPLNKEEWSYLWVWVGSFVLWAVASSVHSRVADTWLNSAALSFGCPACLAVSLLSGSHYGWSQEQTARSPFCTLLIHEGVSRFWTWHQADI